MVDTEVKSKSPLGCTCGLLYEIRKVHGKQNCRYLNYPYPGSRDAIVQDCKCPTAQNVQGKGILNNGQVFYWVAGVCSLHGELK